MEYPARARALGGADDKSTTRASPRWPQIQLFGKLNLSKSRFPFTSPRSLVSPNGHVMSHLLLLPFSPSVSSIYLLLAKASRASVRVHAAGCVYRTGNPWCVWRYVFLRERRRYSPGKRASERCESRARSRCLWVREK